MAVQYNYPTTAELREIEPDLIQAATLDDPIFTHFPINSVNEDALAWEIKDNFSGLQAIRGLNGSPEAVAQVAANRFLMEPGYFGEVASIDETQLTKQRPLGAWNGVIDLTTAVREKQDQLIIREVMRQRFILWTLVSTGSIVISTPDGHRSWDDYYTLQSAVAAVGWATSATATPLADFRAIVLLGQGSSSKFDSRSTAYMNQRTFNLMVTNTNANDLAGRRVSALLSPLSLSEIAPILNNENMPRIVVYDDGYQDDSDVFQNFVPDDTVVIMGARPAGSPLGEYRLTRNANNPDMGPGSYVHVVDSADGGNPIPRKIDVHRGHNGGPVVFYPNGVVILDVS